MSIVKPHYNIRLNCLSLKVSLSHGFCQGLRLFTVAGQLFCIFRDQNMRVKRNYNTTGNVVGSGDWLRWQKLLLYISRGDVGLVRPKTYTLGAFIKKKHAKIHANFTKRHEPREHICWGRSHGLEEKLPLCTCPLFRRIVLEFWGWENWKGSGNLRNLTLLLLSEEANFPEQHQKS